jgi:hypothetical protein
MAAQIAPITRLAHLQYAQSAFLATTHFRLLLDVASIASKLLLIALLETILILQREIALHAQRVAPLANLRQQAQQEVFGAILVPADTISCKDSAF